MASEQWQADINDLADLYQSKDKSLDGLGTRIRLPVDVTDREDFSVLW